MKTDIQDKINTIKKLTPDRQVNIMEVCGTHTMAIAKNGLKQLLPENIKLISGPGCPVCVTSNTDIDNIIEIIRNYDNHTFTFGDMVRVPGTYSSLYYEKTMGKNITVCYSPMDALHFAENHPSSKVIFLAIGFETTAPLTAVLAKRILGQKVDNLFVFNTHKLVPPALKTLLADKQVKIDAFLCPGHVSAIIGTKPYEFIPEKHKIPCVISGFEPLDILDSIIMILMQIRNSPKVEIQYKRVVKKEGNPSAMDIIYDVFKDSDSIWRGIGMIPESGLAFKGTYSHLDAAEYFKVEKPESKEPKGCSCGEVLKGLKSPSECLLFEKTCRPDNPIGPCMVSSEGSCAAFYRYERLQK